MDCQLKKLADSGMQLTLTGASVNGTGQFLAGGPHSELLGTRFKTGGTFFARLKALRCPKSNLLAKSPRPEDLVGAVGQLAI
jgi:hypothetical protein